MANAKLGSRASYGETFVQILDTDGTQLTPGDSGKIFMCKEASSARTVNLPPVASSAGVKFKFVLELESSAAFNIVVYGLTASGGSTGDSNKLNFMRVADAGARSYNRDGVSFTADSNKGDFIDIFCDGDEWHAHCFGSDDDHFAALSD